MSAPHARLGWGLFGGTFDPIHNGHLHIAQALYAELHLEQVALIPVGRPVHRAPATLSNADRLILCQLAVADTPQLRVDDRELRCAHPSYTVDTLRTLRAEVGPDYPLVWLIGSDSLLQLHTWHRWQDLFTLAHLAVAMRPGFDFKDLAPEVAVELANRTCTRNGHRIAAAGTIAVLAAAPQAISATQIRSDLAQTGASCDLPPAVARYIAQHHLYALAL